MPKRQPQGAPVPGQAAAEPPRLLVTALAVYFTMIGVVGSILAYRATPMSGIDEMFHFKRALQVSELRLFAPSLGRNDWGGRLDRKMLDYEKWFDDRRNAHIRVGLAGAREAEAAIAAEPAGTRLESFPSTASYSPLPYVPAALGLGIARVLHADLSTAVYAGRLASLYGYMLMLACVVAMLPIGRIGALALLSTPTAVHLASSYSADPMTNTVAAFFAAWCLRLRLAPPRDFSTTQRRLFVVLAVAVGLLKLTCALCGLLVLIVPATAFADARQAWRFRLFCVAACLAAALAWNLAYPFVPGLYWGSGADPRAALHRLLSQPLHEAGDIAGNIAAHGYFWWVDGYSRFCTGPLPFYYIFDGAASALALAVVGLLGMAENRTRSAPLPALLFALVASLYTVGVLLAFKIGFSPPGRADIAGLQGRYFLLPLAIFYLGAVMALPARIGLRPAIVPLLGIYLVLTVHFVIALLADYAPEWS